MCELLWVEVQALSVAPKALAPGLGLPKALPAFSSFLLCSCYTYPCSSPYPLL